MALAQILKEVDPKWHKEFRVYVKTGRASREFHEYLDQHPSAMRALEQAAELMARAFVESLHDGAAQQKNQREAVK